MNPVTKGYLIAMVGIVLWSTTGVFVGYLITTYDMPPLLLAFWRNLLVSIAMLPVLYVIRRSLLRITMQQLRFFVFFGLILALFNSIWILSVEANGAAVSTVLAYSSAGFTAILAWWLFREPLSPIKITAVTLSLIGCVLVAEAYDPQIWKVNLLGILTGIASGVLFAGYNLMGKEAAQRQINPWTSLLYSFIFGSVFTLLFCLIPGVPGGVVGLAGLMPQLPADGWLILLVLSFIPTLLGFGLYNVAMKYLPASVASLLATTEPAMTTVEAYLFLNERMSVIQIVGSLVILFAVVMIRFDKPPSESRFPKAAG
ncbi:MAG TPA: DMT family transporter [Aggregatilineales bacterium]|nr:DMT family transporter [Aggregatilineales bacterium]